ncbi:MAG: SDR family oxidoreductase [Deltaproteobacteria bacterium]|jgi:WW domain-containing oxidoreductase|nr:SDR family oxidoreductase [Deltaproteobacteria bacterium]MBW2534420.1 SDR family oxidoreductase [Deltaproteobacteria bacterium]
MSLYAALKRPGPNGFGHASTAEEVTAGLDLAGKTYLLTGCNSGIGLETLRVLGLRGGHVVAAARTEDKAREALSEVGAEGTAVACELSSPASVRGCVAAVRQLERPLDGIICNAGIMALPKPERKHGIELQLLTNHVGHFMLVTELLDALTDDGRVVVVSSDAHRRAPREGIRFDDLAADRGYSPWGAYGQSKLANILFARQLTQRLAEKQTANSLHPGVISTNLSRHMNPVFGALEAVVGPLFFKSIPQGAATQCYLATHPDAAGTTAAYFADCNVAAPSSLAADDGLAARLWEATEKIVADL